MTSSMTMTRRGFLAALAASAACGGVTVPDRNAPGLHELRDRIRGTFRDSHLLIPSGLGDEWVPMLVVLHDQDETATTVIDRWRPVCEKRGWVGVFPRYHKTGLAEDNAFLAHLMRRATAMGGCTPRRRFLVGQGAGGRRAYAMASANGFMITAMATSGAPTMVDPADLGPQAPGDPVPSILHLHGGRDERVPLAGGPLQGEKLPHTVSAAADGLGPWVAALGATASAPPQGWPPRLQLTRWATKDRQVVLAIDPDHGTGWNSAVGTGPIADFLEGAPDRVGMTIP